MADAAAAAAAPASSATPAAAPASSALPAVASKPSIEQIMRKASSDDATALQRGIGKVVLAQAVTTHLVKQVGKNPTRKYLVVRHLASGAHGRVELVQRLRDARLLVMKKTHGTMSQEAEREVRVLEHLKHPSIVRVHEHFVDPVGQNLCIVMDYAAGGDLQHFLDRRKAADAPLTDKQVLGVLVQLLGAVAHCHQRSVLHRDIKPSNIFVTTTSAAEATRRRTLQTRLIHPPSSASGEGSQSGGLPRPDHSQEGEDLIIFLGDFGISRELDTEKALAQTITGTPYYLAPEIIRGEGYGIKSDIWAVRARRTIRRAIRRAIL